MNLVETVVRERAAARAFPSFHETEAEVDARVGREIAASISYYVNRGPDDITRRLGELEHEWSVERMIAMKAAGITFFGVLGGLFGRKRWLMVAGAALPFLFQQAIEGSSFPARCLRRLGLRTQREIDRERFALKALRGDFEGIAQSEPDSIAKAAAA